MSGISFYLQALLLGLGLGADALSVSLADGMEYPAMTPGRRWSIPAVFALFQIGMPLLGWTLVHGLLSAFSALERVVPWFSLVLLGFLGVRMIVEGVLSLKRPDAPGEEDAKKSRKLTVWTLLLQAVATSLDALSCGLVLSESEFVPVLVTSLIIGGVTFFLCTAGVFFGKLLSGPLSRAAPILGGVILIAVGLKIWITGFLQA